MRLKSLGFGFALLAFAQPLLAGRADDVRVIARHFITPEVEEMLRLSVNKGHTVLYAVWLQKRSVRLLDREKFASLLPDKLSDRLVDALPKVVSERCFAKFADAELRAAAIDIKRNPDGGHAFGQQKQRQFHLDQPEQMVAELEQVNRDLKTFANDLKTDARKRIEFAGAFCVIMTVGMAGRYAVRRGNDQPDLTIEGLAEIVGQPGMAEFPNRIVKRRVLGEIRSFETKNR